MNLKRIDKDSHVWLDNFTIKNLEILYPSNENGSSLIDVIDFTCTPMGSRMIKKCKRFFLHSRKNETSTYYFQFSVLHP